MKYLTCMYIYICMQILFAIKEYPLPLELLSNELELSEKYHLKDQIWS